MTLACFNVDGKTPLVMESFMIYSSVINPFQAIVMICLETKDRGRRMNGTKAVVREARKQ